MNEPTRTFPVVLRRGESGRYVVECPAISGCFSQGETVEDAIANIREAIELCLEDLAERGEPLPIPGTLLLSEVAIAS